MGQQYVNQWVRPHFWFLVYADPNTCGPTPLETNEVVQYELTFLNPDSKGEATDHFGDDLRGLYIVVPESALNFVTLCSTCQPNILGGPG